MKAAVLVPLSLFLSGFVLAQMPADSAGRQAADSIQKIATDTVAKLPRTPRTHQLRLGFDLYRIAYNLMWPSRQGYEAQIDYAITQKTYVVAEAGFGKGKIDYSFLQYNSSSYFLRLGMDQQFLDVISIRDFDIGFIGLRYGVAAGKRSTVDYEIANPFGPPVAGSLKSQNYVVHWGEVTGGIKVEFWKGFFVGWNIRGKFMFNSGIFKEIAPNYIAGYGKGDKSTNFDFNFYLSYAIRWKGK